MGAGSSESAGGVAGRVIGNLARGVMACSRGPLRPGSGTGAAQHGAFGA
jgi:hypothetical protein